jgi:hypothetical protein
MRDVCSARMCRRWRSPSVTLSHPQSPSVTLSHPQSPSVTLSHPQSPSVTLSHPQSASVTLSHPQSPSVCLSLPQSPSVTLSHPQSPSVTLSHPQSPSVCLARGQMLPAAALLLHCCWQPRDEGAPACIMSGPMLALHGSIWLAMAHWPALACLRCLSPGLSCDRC